MTIKGQSILEYVVLVGIVTMALLYMGTDFKRAIQGIVKVTADQLGNQKQSDQDFGYETTTGILVNSMTNTQQDRQKTTQNLGTAGTRVLVSESTKTLEGTLTNQSFTAVLPSNYY